MITLVKKQILSFVTLALFVVNAQSAEVIVKAPDRNVVATVTDDGVDLGANMTLGKSSLHTIRETYAMFGGQLNPGK
ncbi:MAG TPA: hypothetical protein VL863_00060 [bacterium]|jgi:hypothetical protein|nr:hypothetical protein [bacterium]